MIELTDKARLTFFLKNKQFFMRYSLFIPRKGEEVRIQGIIYKIKKLVWCYDEKLLPNKVNIEIIKVKEA